MGLLGSYEPTLAPKLAAVKAAADQLLARSALLAYQRNSVFRLCLLLVAQTLRNHAGHRSSSLNINAFHDICMMTALTYTYFRATDYQATES